MSMTSGCPGRRRGSAKTTRIGKTGIFPSSFWSWFWGVSEGICGDWGKYLVVGAELFILSSTLNPFLGGVTFSSLSQAAFCSKVTLGISFL